MKSSFVFLFIMVFVFLSFAEQIDCQTNNKNNDSLKIFYGFHLSPEVNMLLKNKFPFLPYRYIYYELGYNYSFDVSVLFIEKYGINSGVSFLYSPFKYNLYHACNSLGVPCIESFYEHKGYCTMLGIPIKFLLNKDISNHIGVFMKTGVDSYFQIKSEMKEDNIIIKPKPMNTICFIEEMVLGITYRKTDNVIYSLGFSEHYSFSNIVYSGHKFIFMGIQTGIKFKF